MDQSLGTQLIDFVKVWLFFTALTGSRFLWDGKKYKGKVVQCNSIYFSNWKMKTIFTSLDFDIAKNGRKCTHPCGSKKSPLSTLKDWCYTDEGNEKWEYCIKGNY